MTPDNKEQKDTKPYKSFFGKFRWNLSVSPLDIDNRKLSEKHIKEIVQTDKSYLKNNNTEPWALRWIAAPIGYLCSKEKREEWLGDLYEVIHEMQTKSYPIWTIDLICIGKTTILIFSAFEIKITDFLTLFKKS